MTQAGHLAKDAKRIVVISGARLSTKQQVQTSAAEGSMKQRF